MIYFTSKNRVRKLPFLQKLWMAPVAYILKYSAGGVLLLADKFDAKVVCALIED